MEGRRFVGIEGRAVDYGADELLDDYSANRGADLMGRW
jgi:hypothetical protein